MPTISDLLLQPVRETDWLIYPILGRQAITFFHGKSGLGKTPLAWEIARSLSVGSPSTAFGLEVRCEPATVLYLEAETALRNTLPRLHLLSQPVGSWWYEDMYETGADILDPRHPCRTKLSQLSRELSPDLVIWSSCRRFFRRDMNDSLTTVDVYKAMVGFFPQAGHLVISHDKKSAQDPDKEGDPNEAFSGSNAWVQQASVGLHVTSRTGAMPGTHAVLEVTKSQLGPSKEWGQFKIHLGPDGMTWQADLGKQIAELWPLAPPGDKAQWVADQLKIDRSTVYRNK